MFQVSSIDASRFVYREYVTLPQENLPHFKQHQIAFYSNDKNSLSFDLYTDPLNPAVIHTNNNNNNELIGYRRQPFYSVIESQRDL